jgi:transcription antitermination factor NusG
VSCLQNSSFATTAVGSDVAFSESSWYAIQTFPRHEKKITAELQHKGIKTLLPLVSEKHQWSDRRVSVDTPLFPGYVFVRINQDQAARVAVLRTSGVRNFVGMRGLGDPIPDSQIEGVQAILSKGVPFSSSAFLNVGQRVRVRGGSLEGVEGIVTSVNGDKSLVISVDLIQKSLAIRITGFAIEPIQSNVAPSSF